MRTAPNRWIIALAGVWLQLFLGTVYAWSYFQQPLVDKYGWANTSVAWTFSLAICFLGLAAAWGGTKLPTLWPAQLAVDRRPAVRPGLSAGRRGAPLAARLPLLYLGYGVVGGTGLGLGYVTPVATVAKWFPDKKGLATGLVIMGFGFGAPADEQIDCPGVVRLVGREPGDRLRHGSAWCFMAATLLGRRLLRESAARLCSAAGHDACRRPRWRAGRPIRRRRQAPGLPPAAVGIALAGGSR